MAASPFIKVVYSVIGFCSSQPEQSYGTWSYSSLPTADTFSFDPDTSIALFVHMKLLEGFHIDISCPEDALDRCPGILPRQLFWLLHLAVPGGENSRQMKTRHQSLPIELCSHSKQDSKWKLQLWFCFPSGRITLFLSSA